MIKCFLLTKVDFITALNVHLFLFYQEERNEGRKEIEKERERKPHMGICTLYIHLCNNSCVCMPTCMYVICTQMNILKSSSSIREGNGTPLPVFIWWLSRESLKLRLTWSLLLLVKYCCLNVVDPKWRKRPFSCSQLCSISKEKLQQFFLPIYKMRLIGQKEHRGSGGLINLASHEGQKAKSSKMREFWVLLKIYT